VTQTALLVIDVQRAAFDGERCPPIDQPQRLVTNAVSLVNAAHEAGAPIVFIQHCEGAGEPFEEGSPHWELHEALVPLRNDTLLRKYASSAFEGTSLGKTLEGFDVRELVLCGLQSEFCVQNTARSALGAGFTVVIAQDGHGTWPSKTESASEISERINRELESRGAQLKSTADLVRSLRETRA
jgi:nicotinamidase-related amidase